MIAVVPLVVLAALGLALGYVKLKHSPISLGVLVAPIENGINAELDGYLARVEDAILMLTDDGRLEFRLKNVSFAEADGDKVASAPLAAIEISQPALWKGQLAPSRVELIEPTIFATYSADKGLALSFSAAHDAPRSPEGAESGKDGTRLDGGGAAGPEGLIDNTAPRRARPAVQADGAGVAPAGSPDPSGGTALKRLDLMQLVARTSRESRATGTATSFLREFGLRNARLHVDNDGRRSVWQVPELVLDLERRKRQTILSGRARIASRRGSWAVAFHTEDDGGRLAVNTSIRDLVPSELVDAGQVFGALTPVDLPVAADLRIALSREGELLATDLAVELGRGRILIHERDGEITPVPVEAGLVKLAYDHKAGTVKLAPSTVRWSGNTITLTGEAKPIVEAGSERWGFDLHSLEGSVSAGEFGVEDIAVDDWRAAGVIHADQKLVEVRQVALKIGGRDVSGAGELSYAPGGTGARFELNAGDIGIGTLKALWPAGLAPKTRKWVGQNVSAATIEAFNLKIESGAYVKGAAAGDKRQLRALLTVAANDAVFRPDSRTPPVSAPRALIRLEGDALEVTVPEALILLPTGASVAVKSARLTSDDVHREPTLGELKLKSSGDIGPVIELLSSGSDPLLTSGDLRQKRLHGRLDADLAMTFPLIEGLDASAIRLNGKAKLVDGRARDIFGDLDVEGASIGFDFNSGAVEARGEALVKGVPVKIAWQRIFEAPADRQPPLRITTTLDNAYRTQLGLDINHIVQGDVAVDIQVEPRPGREDPAIHVRADLTSADLLLSAISWRKPPGRNAFAEFDIEGSGNKRELRNIRVAGDSIAIQGWAGIGSNQRLTEFEFPEFSLNVVTRLKVSGTLGANNVWKINAKGPTFDGKDFFRALFLLGRVSDNEPLPNPRGSGIDLQADIDTILGFGDVAMRGLSLSLSRRGGKLAALDAKGKLDGGGTIAAFLDATRPGGRRLRANSTDGGQAFKLTGFYPNMQGGRVRLEVNIDGEGAADKTGVLWVDDFRVLGDPVVAEVVSSVDEGRPSLSGQGSRRVVRQVFEFDSMRVPFSVGHGQFVMEDAFVRGPLVGATLRGKVDYKTERMSLGGTYIPLQGLNNAFGQIPVLGQILSGPRGEGLFGITFAIQGAMASPQVIVNPLSLVAPGIFREVFQMTNPAPQVLPRKIDAPSTRRRPAAAPDTQIAPPGTTIDGWSSETKRK